MAHALRPSFIYSVEWINRFAGGLTICQSWRVKKRGFE
jgi:hypothetical protein